MLQILWWWWANIFFCCKRIEICLLSNDIYDYNFVSQGKITIPNVDDGEECTLTDVSAESGHDAMFIIDFFLVLYFVSMSVEVAKQNKGLLDGVLLDDYCLIILSKIWHDDTCLMVVLHQGMICKIIGYPCCYY